MTKTLKAPIQLVSDKDLVSLCDPEYLQVFDEAPWDEYLLRQSHIEYLQTALGDQFHKVITIQHIANYYLGKLSWNDLAGLLRHSYSEHIQGIALIKPTRKRFISEFEIHIENNKPRIERIPTKPFGQTLAEIENNTDFDFRKLSRVFTELPGKYLTESLYSLIRKVTKKISNNNESPKKIHLSVHHTRIVCTSDANASNSPEGIHQDGMDYIVSAFVVERHNIDGGESIIYNSDKKTPILKAVLQPGMGIFQPDLGSGLWHTVTPISATESYDIGWRSSIGLNFTIEEYY